MAPPQGEIVFAPLGGVGEIGMNLAIYGLGDARRRTWLVVDVGVSFAQEENLPGIDLMFPDIRYLVEERRNIAGIVLTHAHEDHYGALLDLWPKLQAPVYATPFTAALLEAKQQGEYGAPDIPIKEVAVGSRFNVGPFDIELCSVAHSIPESNALILRTPHGNVLHTGDWKLDPTPVLGLSTDEAKLRAFGAEGCHVLIGDSTNAVREGRSPSESDVARTLTELIVTAPRRVAVTTFASNVARIRAVADAARKAEREVVALCTGSQGEPRAALARIAQDEHPEIALSRGDRVVFSSRPIPGNEKAIGRVINGLIDQGVEVITDRTHLVHVSGHPRQAELEDMLGWVKPRHVIPVHGEALHLSEHAALARRHGARTLTIRNGDLVRLAPGNPEIVDEVPAGRTYKDGALLIQAEARTVADRKRLAFAGLISVALAIDDKGNLLADPEVELIGIPDNTGDGDPMDTVAYNAVVETFDSLPKPRRRDPDSVAEAIRRGVRAAVGQHWRKKPNVTVHVLVA